jgi:hypothetical protein
LFRWILARSEMIFCDGTFDSAPPPFAQIYFVLGKMANNRAVPCVFALLPNKASSTYRKMWEHISSLVDFTAGCPSRFSLDFEQAAMNAVAAALPGVKICGCHFHQTQVGETF